MAFSEKLRDNPEGVDFDGSAVEAHRLADDLADRDVDVLADLIHRASTMT